MTRCEFRRTCHKQASHVVSLLQSFERRVSGGAIVGPTDDGKDIFCQKCGRYTVATSRLVLSSAVVPTVTFWLFTGDTMATYCNTAECRLRITQADLMCRRRKHPGNPPAADKHQAVPASGMIWANYLPLILGM